MKSLKKAYVLNLIIFALVVFSVACMMSGIGSKGSDGVMVSPGLKLLKYYTIDSNIIMGVVALWTAIMERKVIKGQINELPVYASIIKLLGTVGVVLAFLVTTFFLVPTSDNWIMLYLGSSFFLHLFTPILSSVTFVCFEKTSRIKFYQTLYGTVSLVIYAIYYVANALINSADGIVPREYDWYGFFIMGTKSVLIVLPIILVVTYIISLTLWALNRKKNKE